MTYDSEMLRGIGAIYKYLSKNPNVHKNTMRKDLIMKGKFATKETFSRTLESLIALGKITINKDMVSINPALVEIGVMQRDGDKFFVVTPESNKHLKIDKSVAAGYNVGEIVDIVIEHSGEQQNVVVLGKSKKQLQTQTPVASKKQQDVQTAFNKESLILGRVVKLNHDELVFIPNKKSISTRHIPILNAKEEYSRFQDKICVMDLSNINTPLMGGYIVDVKGDAGNPIHEYDAIAESYGAIMNWSGAALEDEISKIPTRVDADALPLISEKQAETMQRGHVVDLRHLPFATVDPATCKDMDDAIYSTFDENGDIVTYTAVANVTKYVDLDSEIGRRYINGAFTIYAPNKAYSILPSELSTGICSLNPNEDRLAFVVKTVLDKSTGKVKSSNIYDAVIKSRQKYSYEQAQQIVDYLDGDDSKAYLQYKVMTGEPLLPEEQVLLNYYAAQTIKVGFDQRKMIRFTANKEREIKFDSDLQDVVDIAAIPHLLYHEVIEAFMITANEATAKYANDNGLDNIYRVHDEPNPRKLERATEFFDILGIEFDGNLSAQGTRSLIELIKDTPSEEVINNFLIKMQSRAVYSDHLYSERKQKDLLDDWLGEKISHYALQSPHYSHTTSPIRRGPDYATQYNILAHMHGTKPLSADRIKQIVEVANSRQLDVDQAEKDFDDISSVIYCEKHIGEKMKGRVSKIRNTSPEEGYNDDIVVIVKNEEKGISVEIPLSQILGRQTRDYFLSEQRCAVYDDRGNIVLTLCKPIEFIIDRADRKTMIVVGRTNKEMANYADSYPKGHHSHGEQRKSSINKKTKNKRYKQYRQKKESGRRHKYYQDDDYGYEK